MSYQLVYWAICIVVACWIIVIGHQVGWSLIDPQTHDFWRATLNIAYPVVFVSTAAFIVAAVLAIKK